MHSLIFPTGFIFVRVLGGPEPLPACRVWKAEILSQGEYIGIKSFILKPVGSLESPVLGTYCTVFFLTGNWSILIKPTKNVEERETPNKKGRTAAWSFQRWQSQLQSRTTLAPQLKRLIQVNLANSFIEEMYTQQAVRNCKKWWIRSEEQKHWHLLHFYSSEKTQPGSLQSAVYTTHAAEIIAVSGGTGINIQSSDRSHLYICV